MLNKQTYKIVFSDAPKAKLIAIELEKILKKFLSPAVNLTPNYLFSIGGDGTFIKHGIEYNKPNTKIIGINGGNLGFYSSFSEKDLHKLISNWKKLNFEKIDLLKVKQKNQTWIGINELAITSSTAYPLEIYFDNIFYEKFRGTGILIGTRPGSTGFIKSAKGAIMFPKINALEFVELQPLLHKEFITIQSPLILPLKTKINIKSEKNYNFVSNICRVFLDGNEIDGNFVSSELEITSVKSQAKFLLPNTLESFIKKLQKTFI
ncbi:NAD(+) kinase [Mycoplasmoides pirum]|uniref:NAD(+) kinase n=1 Tax=Mycoplasmoides pirum TaxID=2122 RepID=UPI00055F30D2|nr:NAD(+) kinase [Mycoplasmoides pirum]